MLIIVGNISTSDYVTIRNIINGTTTNTKTVNGTIEINSEDPKNCLIIKDENNNAVTSLGVGGINSTCIVTDNFICGTPGQSYNDFVGTTINGETGNVTCVSLTQTSREESKKNFRLLQNGLDIIKNTDIYEYNFKSEYDDNKKHIGFVIGKDYNYAHEITAEDNNKEEIGADIYSMVSAAYKAIQEQQEMIEQLQEEIKELKGEK